MALLLLTRCLKYGQLLDCCVLGMDFWAFSACLSFFVCLSLGFFRMFRIFPCFLRCQIQGFLSPVSEIMAGTMFGKHFIPFTVALTCFSLYVCLLYRHWHPQRTTKLAQSGPRLCRITELHDFVSFKTRHFNTTTETRDSNNCRSIHTIQSRDDNDWNRANCFWFLENRCFVWKCGSIGWTTQYWEDNFRTR